MATKRQPAAKAPAKPKRAPRAAAKKPRAKRVPRLLCRNGKPRIPLTWLYRHAAASGSVVAAVRKDLEVIAERDQELADGAIAATALALARELDDPDSAATSRATCSRALVETLEKLRALAPPKEQKDGLDEVTARRHQRLARRSAT